jgi:hypothetical protein
MRSGDVPEAEQLAYRTLGELETAWRFRLKTPANWIDPDIRRVIHRDGDLAYDALIVATGATPIRPDLPGLAFPACTCCTWRTGLGTGPGRETCAPGRRQSLDDSRNVRLPPSRRRGAGTGILLSRATGRAGPIIGASGLRGRRSGLGGRNSGLGPRAVGVAIRLRPAYSVT